MIIVWYNQNKDCYYAKYVLFHLPPEIRVGYENNWGHKIVCMFYLLDKKLIACDSWEDYYYNKFTFKQRFLRKLIKFFERLERKCRK